MLSEHHINQLRSKILEQLGLADGGGGQRGGDQGCGGQGGDGSATVSLTPSSVLVVLGLLTGVLEVISVLVDRDQTVQFILGGSLKRRTDLDRAMDDLGSHSFDEVMKAILGRFS